MENTLGKMEHVTLIGDENDEDEEVYLFIIDEKYDNSEVHVIMHSPGKIWMEVFMKGR